MTDPFFENRREAFRLFIAGMEEESLIKLLGDLNDMIVYKRRYKEFKEKGHLSQN